MKAYVLLVAAVASFTLVAGADAADLSLQPRAHRVIHRHFHTHAVRDYDGTPVVWVPYRGSVRAIVSQRSSPSHWLNGEPVLPNAPRGWPRHATLRYQMMSAR